jgi:dynein heavy chain 1
MKDFPLNELLSATDLDKIQESLNRKLKLSPYPVRRAPPLVEATSRDFNGQLLRVLTSHRPSYTPYEAFARLSQFTNIFRTWDNLIKEFTHVVREVTRKRQEKFILIKVVPAHAKLHYCRKQHEQLAVMTGPTKGLAEDGVEVGGYGYEVVKRIDVLDVSVGAYTHRCRFVCLFMMLIVVVIEGTEIWVAAENAYNEQVARVGEPDYCAVT